MLKKLLLCDLEYFQKVGSKSLPPERQILKDCQFGYHFAIVYKSKIKYIFIFEIFLFFVCGLFSYIRSRLMYFSYKQGYSGPAHVFFIYSVFSYIQGRLVYFVVLCEFNFHL